MCCRHDMASSDDDGTFVRLCAPPAGAPRMWVVDPQHGLTLVHRPGVHRETMAAPLHYLRISYDCDFCGTRGVQVAVGGHACLGIVTRVLAYRFRMGPRCDTTWPQAFGTGIIC
jgi:hypothetical protein